MEEEVEEGCHQTLHHTHAMILCGDDDGDGVFDD
jgi:hypothetical protein